MTQIRFPRVFRAFVQRQSGAVTVDWAILTAAVIGLGLAVIGAVRTGTHMAGQRIETSLIGASVVDIDCTGAGHEQRAGGCFIGLTVSRLVTTRAWGIAGPCTLLANNTIVCDPPTITTENTWRMSNGAVFMQRIVQTGHHEPDIYWFDDAGMMITAPDMG